MPLSAPPEIEENRQLSASTLNWIARHNLWNLWVPRDFGGLEADLLDGLRTLQSLARTDGSLGWTVTLCAGANYFIGNLKPEFSAELFIGNRVILGGSGGLFGDASKTATGYRLNGQWRYATGAPYLTHFTLNARLLDDGKGLNDRHGQPQFSSFVVPADQVEVVDDWQTMGLVATATHSFTVQDVGVTEHQAFHYETVFLPQAIYQLNFSVFADFTLWVNYIGMAEHFLALSNDSVSPGHLQILQETLSHANQMVETLATECLQVVSKKVNFTEPLVSKVHREASMSVAHISQAISAIYPYTGIKGASQNSAINRVFRDYFTATQHHIFIA
ncbi:MAG: acyl-CoA dehydrogenase [Gammaproteobacteria bacterium]|nr:acyl-CoA dehydrogenase [Gammaproteobacteria bacterium]